MSDKRLPAAVSEEPKAEDLAEPTLTIDVKGCARCGECHESLMFHAFVVPPESSGHRMATTHWAHCPRTNEPILMGSVDYPSGLKSCISCSTDYVEDDCPECGSNDFHWAVEPLEMYLCEANNVVLQPRTYRFVVDPRCELCKKAAIDATDFGVPTVSTHPTEPVEKPRDWKHNCEDWAMEGVACAKCNPIATAFVERKEAPARLVDTEPCVPCPTCLGEGWVLERQESER